MGRVAVVTGGAGGIGRATAARLAADGMSVVVADLDEAAIAGAVLQIRESGGDAIGVRTDVTDPAQVTRLADQTLDRFGAVNVVFLNAGVVIGGRVEELTEEEWRWVLDVDLWGVIRGVRTFLPLIEREGEGHLIATSSTSGVGAPVFNGPYAVAKAGVIAVMETLRRELDDRQSAVGAGVLIPGPVRTGLVRTSAAMAESIGRTSDTSSGHRFHHTAHTLLQETGLDPATVAAMVLDAIRTNRFWVLTHPEWAGVLRNRVEAMVTTGELTARAP